MEGTIEITPVEQAGEYADGTPFTLVEPQYEILGPDGEPIPDLLLSPRIAPAVFGVGLLEGIPADDILALADPDDDDGDGISGRANLVPDPDDPDGDRVLGRFGWKAAVPSVREQNAGAFAGDIGITSSIRPEQPCTRLQAECISAPDGGDPELDDRKLEQVTFYTRTLAVPPAATRVSRRPPTGRPPSKRSGARRATSASCAPARPTSRPSTAR